MGESTPFTGAAGETQSDETIVWCAGCGAWYGARCFQGLNAAKDTSLLERLLESGYEGLNRMVCPRCAEVYIAQEPLRLHLPQQAQLFLLIPETLRHRAQQLRAELIQAVVADPGEEVPLYALEPKLLVGHLQLKALFSPASGQEQSVQPQSRVVENEPSLFSPEQALEHPHQETLDISSDSQEFFPEDLKVEEPEFQEHAGVQTSPASVQQTLEAEPTELLEPARVEESDAPIFQIAPDPEVSEEAKEIFEETALDSNLFAELPSDKLPKLLESLGSQSLPLPPSLSSKADLWDVSLDDAWSLDEPEPSTPEEATQVVKMEEMERRPSGPFFDEERAEGDNYIELDGEAVRLVYRLEPERACAFEEEGDSELWFQLHQTSSGPVLLLLLLRLKKRELLDQLFWVIPHETRRGEGILDALQQSFGVDVIFHNPDGSFHGRRIYRAALERNVISLRAAAKQLEQEQQSNLEAARLKVCASDFPRLGRLQHNFQEESFSTLSSAADAGLALGILSYWSAPERRDYLLRIKSFPEVWYEKMLSRVLKAALHFGLSMEPHLRRKALEMELAESSSKLLQSSLVNFAEVHLGLRSSQLDALDTWENWEALLALAEELDLRVEEDIEALAVQALERARQAAQSLESIHIDAGSSIEMEEVTELSELGDGDLLGLLEGEEHRLEASLILLNRGEIYIPAIFDAIQTMNREELNRMVPGALAQGPNFESAFLNGLSSSQLSLRLASALFLAEIRSERAIKPLLLLMTEADERLWPVLARAIARMGRRIIQPALEQLTQDAEALPRITRALALLGTDARGALGAAREQQGDELSQHCISAALEQMREVGFGDAADFKERLAEAFEVAGIERSTESTLDSAERSRIEV